MPDGDYKFYLKVEKRFESMLNEGNYNNKSKGNLVVEVDPMYRNPTYLPVKGDKVNVTGAWVPDVPMKWNEIHPSWKLQKLVVRQN